MRYEIQMFLQQTFIQYHYKQTEKIYNEKTKLN